MFRIVSLLSMFVLVGCNTIPLAQRDTYGVCKQYIDTQPYSAAERVALGVFTLGMSELGMASDRAENEEALLEMKRRNISDCSAVGQAKYECGKIYSDTESKEFQACVLSTSNAVSGRMASDLAAEQAAAATAAAISAQSRANQAAQQTQNNTWWAK